jgi:hypothetical protein
MDAGGMVSAFQTQASFLTWIGGKMASLQWRRPFEFRALGPVVPRW